MREGQRLCGTFWECEVVGKKTKEGNKEKKVRARVWRKWHGKRGKKEIRKTY